MSPTNKTAPVLEFVVDAIKFVNGLLDSGLVDAARSVLDSVTEGLENEHTVESMEARLQASQDVIATKRESVDERIRRVRERQEREKFDTSEDETMPGTDPSEKP